MRFAVKVMLIMASSLTSGGSKGIADDRDHGMTIVKYHILTATREKLFLDEFWFSRMWKTAVIEILFLFLTRYS